MVNVCRGPLPQPNSSSISPPQGQNCPTYSREGSPFPAALPQDHWHSTKTYRFPTPQTGSGGRFPEPLSQAKQSFLCYPLKYAQAKPTPYSAYIRLRREGAPTVWNPCNSCTAITCTANIRSTTGSTALAGAVGCTAPCPPPCTRFCTHSTSTGWDSPRPVPGSTSLPRYRRTANLPEPSDRSPTPSWVWGMLCV